MEQAHTMTRINVGCGITPTEGWRNFDNSFGVQLSKIPFAPEVLHRLRFLDSTQYQFSRFARENGVEYGDATIGLPIPDDSCDVLYSSHMMEHLDRTAADLFLKEALRVLRPDGILRIAVPDIEKHVARYHECGDANAFMEAMDVCVAKPTSLVQRISLLLVGMRHHQWMYDGNSVSGLLLEHGFVGVEVMPPGKTGIVDSQPLDLHERSSQSVYVEARKPSP